MSERPVWARLVAAIFHPLFGLTIALFLGITFDSTLKVLFNAHMLQLTFIILITGTVIFPLINIYLLKRYGAITNYDLPTRKERFYPLFATLLYYVLVYVLVHRAHLPGVFYSMCMATIAAIAVGALFNLFMKVSLHCIAAGGILGMLLGLFHLHGTGNAGLLICLVLLLGLVASARLASQSHKPIEVYAGSTIGLMAAYLIVLNGWYF